jgi:hypothetical protein
MHIIRLPERASGITQGQVDVVTFLNQMVEIFSFAGEGLFQQPEEVFSLRPSIVVPELDMVPPTGGGILDYEAEIAVLKPVFIHHFAVHILVPEYV